MSEDGLMSTHTNTRLHTIRRSFRASALARFTAYLGSDSLDRAWSPSERALRSVPHFIGTRG